MGIKPTSKVLPSTLNVVLMSHTLSRPQVYHLVNVCFWEQGGYRPQHVFKLKANIQGPSAALCTWHLNDPIYGYELKVIGISILLYIKSFFFFWRAIAMIVKWVIDIVSFYATKFSHDHFTPFCWPLELNRIFFFYCSFKTMWILSLLVKWVKVHTYRLWVCCWEQCSWCTPS